MPRLSAPVLFLLIAAFIALAAFLLIRSIKSAQVEPLYTAEDVESSKAAAQRIIDAIEKYRADKGKAPWTLIDLTPTYIDRIPSTTMPEREWIYDASEPRVHYALGFATTPRRNHAWYWYSEHGRWIEAKP